MIVRSRAAGNVIRRMVVPGNYYAARDTLMVIADMRTLSVVADVSSIPEVKDLAIGQPLTVKYPFPDQFAGAQVESIDWTSAPGRVKIRTLIPNPGLRVKPGMQVRLDLEPAPAPAVPPERVAEPRSQVPSGDGLEARLNAVERKLERLLGENDRQTSNENIIKRLNELERKLERVLKTPAGQ